MNKLLIPLLVLFNSSFAVAGEINVNNSKSITYTKQHTEHWDKKPWARSVSDNSYRKFQTEAMKARYQGYLSKQTVNATIEATVSRQIVLQSAYPIVKKGAKLALKGVPYVGAAYTLYEAYQAVNPTLESAGYHYSENADTYLKVYDNALCMPKFMGESGYYSCIGVDSSVMRALSKGGNQKKMPKNF